MHRRVDATVGRCHMPRPEPALQLCQGCAAGIAQDQVELGKPTLSDIARRLARPQPRDRKSVGKGKSASVRVDLGGRRIITKKIQVTQGNQLLTGPRPPDTKTSRQSRMTM